MILTAIALDDEPMALEIVQIHASKVNFIELKGCFTNAFEAIDFLQVNKIDLIFLDIKMPDISGIEFVNSLQSVPMVIFTTAYSEYAIQGFDMDAIDYLLKPFSLSRFIKASNKALENKLLRIGETKNYIFIKTGYEEEKILLDDILYIESESNYSNFILKDKKVITRQSMAEILIQLPDKQFIRVHRSYIVSIEKIEKLSRQHIYVVGYEIPIGASYEGNLIKIRELILKKQS